MINDKSYFLESPLIADKVSNRVLVPLWFINESLGAEVTWLANEKQIKINNGEREIIVTAGSKVVSVNGKRVTLDSEPMLQSGRIFVSLRFTSELLGASVE